MLAFGSNNFLAIFFDKCVFDLKISIRLVTDEVAEAEVKALDQKVKSLDRLFR